MIWERASYNPNVMRCVLRDALRNNRTSQKEKINGRQ